MNPETDPSEQARERQVRLISTLHLDPGGRVPLPPLAPTPPAAVGATESRMVPTGADVAPWVHLSRVDDLSAPLCVVLHSAVGHSEVLTPTLARLERAGRRAIAPDRRGHGRTPLTRPLDDADDAADTWALVDALAADAPVDLVGSAQGGRIALEVAAAAPERVRSLTLVGSLAGQADPTTILPPQFHQLPSSWRELGAAYRTVDPEGTRRWEALIAAHPTQPRPRPAQTASGASGASAAGAGTGRPDLTRLPFPLLFVAGDADPFCPTPFYRDLHRSVADSGFVVIPEAGHSIPWERPEALTDVLIAFWETL